jgi:hypothetical protein
MSMVHCHYGSVDGRKGSATRVSSLSHRGWRGWVRRALSLCRSQEYKERKKDKKAAKKSKSQHKGDKKPSKHSKAKRNASESEASEEEAEAAWKEVRWDSVDDPFQRAGGKRGKRMMTDGGDSDASDGGERRGAEEEPDASAADAAIAQVRTHPPPLPSWFIAGASLPQTRGKHIQKF